MKKIFLITWLLALSAVAQQSVENSVESVDKNPFPCTKYAKYCNPISEPTLNSKLNYFCQNNEGSFKLIADLNTSEAMVTEFLGQDLYEGFYLKLISKQSGFKNLVTTFKMQHGGQIVVSEHSLMNRAGDNYTVISAKLISNEKTYYFSCN